MPVYQYTAIDPVSNTLTQGKLEAENFRNAKEIIREQGQIPTKLEEDAESASVEHLLEGVLSSGVSLKDITIMTQQLYTLLEAGVPLIESLFLLEQQSTKKRQKEVLKKIRADVISGDSFSNAIARFPREFSSLYINMVRAGEVSGELDNICSRLSTLMEKDMELRSKIKGAMVMPIVTIIVIFIVIVIILLMVVPQFQNLFSTMGQELPLPTVMLLGLSEFMQNFWWAVFGVVGVVVVWFSYFKKSKTGKPIVDQWLLTIPLTGDLLNKMYVSSFIRTMATLIGSGVSLVEAIGTAAGTVDNFVMKYAFEKARDSILIGGSLSKPLEQSKMFPLMVCKMIAIGEETGSLEKMLGKAADFLDREVDAAVATLTKMIEPIMTVVLGGILLFVALSLFLPMWDMTSHMTGGG